MMMAQSQIGACGCLRLGAQLAAISRRACLPAKQRAEAIVVMRQHGATLAVLEYLRVAGGFRRESEIMAATGRKHGAVSWALLRLRELKKIKAVPDTVRNSRYMRYGVVTE